MAHVANFSRPVQHKKPPSRAVQTVQANEWWCSQPGRNESLGCQRHAMQQRYAAATGVERQQVNQQLGALLLEAGEAAIAPSRCNCGAFDISTYTFRMMRIVMLHRCTGSG